MVGMEKMLPASCHGLALVSIISRQFMLHLMPFWLPEFFIVWVRGWAGPGWVRMGLGGVGSGEERGAKYYGYDTLYLVSSFKRKLFVALRP